MLKCILLALCILLFTGCQVSQEDTANKAKEQGLKYYNEGEYELAVIEFKKVLDLGLNKDYIVSDYISKSYQKLFHEEIDKKSKKTIEWLEGALAYNKILLYPVEHIDRFNILLDSYLNTWQTNEITIEQYDFFKSEEILSPLGNLLALQYRINDVPKPLIDAINRIENNKRNSMQLARKFTEKHLIIYEERGKVLAHIPSSTDFKRFERMFTGKTGLQKDKLFKEYEGTRVLWQGEISDITKNKSVFFKEDVLVTTRMGANELQNYNKGDIVWYTGIVDSMKGSIFPWHLRNGRILMKVK